jgi:hypothetical protein
MVKLQHERNRGPGEFVLVNGTKYELDEHGNIECSEADAEKLQGGAKWRPPEYWDARRDKIASHTPPTVAGASGRRVRTRNELLATADASGIPLEDVEDKKKAIDEKAPEAREAAAKAQAKANAELVGEEPTIEVSEDMTKSELLALAADCGIKASRAMTKAQILDLFEDAE